MKKGLVLIVAIGLLCMSIASMGAGSRIINSRVKTISNHTQEVPVHLQTDTIRADHISPMVESDEIQGTSNPVTPHSQNSGSDGIWIYTEYDGVPHEKKLDISWLEFWVMVTFGIEKEYHVTLEQTLDTTVKLRFTWTQIVLEDGEHVSVFYTRFTVDTVCDTSEDYQVSLVVRFPFSYINNYAVSNPYANKVPLLPSSKLKVIGLLRNLRGMAPNGGQSLPVGGVEGSHGLKQTHQAISEGGEPLPVGGEPYFATEIGFASPEGDNGPSQVVTHFFFGKDSILDPRVFRMKITPNNLNSKLSYFNSYFTDDGTGQQGFYREFSVDFDPAPVLQITSVPFQLKIDYDFGASAGTKTNIAFKAEGGILDNIVQTFTVDPLPANMKFDLTILGERDFIYESDQSYDISYSLDSEIGGNLVRLEIDDLPKTVHAHRDLILGGGTIEGFVELDMHSDIGRAALYLLDYEVPFIEVQNFPKKLRFDGFVDINDLKGNFTALRMSDDPTVLSASIAFDRWTITDTLELTDTNYIHLSWDLPSSRDSHVELVLDTDNGVIFNNLLSVYDSDALGEVLHVGIGTMETDDLALSWDFVGSSVTNFDWTGRLFRLLNIDISVDYQGTSFDIQGDWSLLESGRFDITLNKDVEIEFVDFENDQFKLHGTVKFNKDKTLTVRWHWGESGYIMLWTHGHPLVDEVTLEFGYSPNANGDYKYGFDVTGTGGGGLMNLNTNLSWYKVGGDVYWDLILDWPPGGSTYWEVWLLWNYNWYQIWPIT